ncbi:MAG: beta-lactamase/D-alanine carboxypeptidase [Planctomycetes bacterium ADurb.Bin126]|nr:MAG: beta-lactamase/D-alanine carboxypeptidase [Planctomycetes bacterium ADurb.Bin126]HOD82140.1 serine hydrolase [Phycisphaerae bacterium]HQL72282.1 serine hydrolase [Phycisphaerae bacterium]
MHHIYGLLLLAALSLPFGLASAAEDAWPGRGWPTATPEQAGLDAARLAEARDYALTGSGSGCVVRGGKLVMTWGDQAVIYDLKSTTKSFGATALGVALADGKVKSVHDRAIDYHPKLGVEPASNLKTGWLKKITLFHLATQTAGFEKPGGYGKLLFEPGTAWSYSDAGPNWLAECLTLAYRRDLNDLMFERVFTPLGITPKDLRWRKNAYRPAQIDGIERREFGAGIHANVNAMARVGLLYLRGGRWRDKQILPAEFVRAASATPKELVDLKVVGPTGQKPPAPPHYGLLWWNNADGAIARLPRDAYWSWGLYDSVILVVPSLDLVVARAGKSFPRKNQTDHEALARFVEPLAMSAKARKSEPQPQQAAAAGLPPPSPVIAGIDWAPAGTIVRQARGSDNWPITWADDDAQYTAYGDGAGFDAPRPPHKLSLGLAKIVGPADGFRAENILSPTGQGQGDGPRGFKACGMVCIKGVLYMFVRNADRRGRKATLAWSADYARTWTWADWTFDEIGYPAAINYGKDYAGAPDAHVYILSPDTPSAYAAGDRVVLLRAPIDKLTRRNAWEYFAGLDAAGKCKWSVKHTDRSGVLEIKNGCNRLAVTYDAPLKRYLMTMRSRSARDAGGREHFSILDAPQPWGPWTTVFSTDKWDTDPGEAQHLPAKWMSADGLTVHLVFSGGDSFSVRKGMIRIRD